jgi:translocator protein
MASAASLITSRSATPPFRVLGGLILLCLAVGWAGSLFTASEIPTWYAALDKPVWTPPNWLFAPVWTTLYVLMGVAGWRVAHPMAEAHGVWPLWWVQLALNGIWTPLFFGVHLVGVALVVIVALIVAVGAFIYLTWSRGRLASVLFIPYLIWICYASSLNAAILSLN